MTTRGSYRKCQALVNQLKLPTPFSVEALVTELVATRRRPIRIRTLPPGFTISACGLWVRTATYDEIYVEANTTRFHREHIVLHEIGHILCEHRDTGGTARPATAAGPKLAARAETTPDVTNLTDAEAELDVASLAKLLPDLQPELIERLLGRTGYSTEEEQEAELVASLIRTTARSRVAPQSTGVLGELEAALGIRSGSLRGGQDRRR